jgi:hypothetical protein
MQVSQKQQKREKQGAGRYHHSDLEHIQRISTAAKTAKLQQLSFFFFIKKYFLK